MNSIPSVNAIDWGYKKDIKVSTRKKAEKPEGLDSYEELYFRWYLQELAENGFILNYEYQPQSFLLSAKKSYTTIKPLKTKQKEESFNFLQEHSYTPDYKIFWNDKAYGVFAKGLDSIVDYQHSRTAFFWSNERVSGSFSLIDVKPLFDMQNMTRQFVINQKWLYDKYNLYCQKAVPEHLFQKTFTPLRFLKTNKSGKDRTLKYTPRSLSQYLESLK